MNVLVLGITPSPLTPIIKESGCFVIETENPIDTGYLQENSIDFMVSYRYRYIIKKPIIEYVRGDIINLHISFLPWNRGADPNLWSFLEDTPKGVTIHYVDEGLDTGDIIAQSEVFFDPAVETLATTYQTLSDKIVKLFKKHWPSIMRGEVQRKYQPTVGSFHRLKDKKKFEYLLLERGWDTPVKKLIGKALH
jgi:methionyl-tRNA formyltransferase